MFLRIPYDTNIEVTGVNTEKLCAEKVNGLENGKLCEVYIDKEIPALSFVHLEVKIALAGRTVPVDIKFQAFGETNMEGNVAIQISDGSDEF